MTENEAIEWLAEETSPTLIHIAEMKKENPMEYINEAVKVACDALWEIQQYREIGTVEEFKSLKDKSVAKKVKYDEYGKEGYPYCECGKCLIDDFVGATYCPDCGQKLDWEGGE